MEKQAHEGREGRNADPSLREIDQMIVQLNEFILPSSLMEKGTRRQSFAFVPPKWWPPGNTGCDCGRGNIRLRHLTGAWGPKQVNEVTGWLSFAQRAGSCGHSTRNSPDSGPI